MQLEKVGDCSDLNPIALRTGKTLQSFGHSECSRVKVVKKHML